MFGDGRRLARSLVVDEGTIQPWTIPREDPFQPSPCIRAKGQRSGQWTDSDGRLIQPSPREEQTEMTKYARDEGRKTKLEGPGLVQANKSA